MMTLELYQTGKYSNYDPRVVIYERKMFIRLATGSAQFRVRILKIWQKIFQK